MISSIALKKRLKKTLYISVLFAGYINSNASKAVAQNVSVDSVQYYIGKTITVCDKVYGTHVTKSAKSATYLNLGANYPNNKLTVVIFEKDLPSFGYVPSIFLKDKNVCVTGKVLLYKDKPEIIVNDSKSITYE
jgi:DNA/RNA endonuclease YhcR with UshA esterase domain